MREEVILEGLDGENHVLELFEKSNNIIELDLEEAFRLVEEAYNLSYNLEFEEGQINSLISMAELYIKVKAYEKSEDYYRQVLMKARETDNREKEIVAIQGVGKIYKYTCEYEKAVKYFTKALEIGATIYNKKTEALLTNNIGEVYYHIKKYNLAEKYFSRCYTISKEINDKLIQADSKSNMARLYYQLNQFEKAIEYCKSAIKIYEEEKAQMNKLGIPLYIIGMVKVNEKKYIEAEKELERALNIAHKCSDSKLVIEILIGLGELYFQLEDKALFAIHFEEALELSKLEDDIQKRCEINKTIAEKYEKLGEFKRANTHLKNYINFLETNNYKN